MTLRAAGAWTLAIVCAPFLGLAVALLWYPAKLAAHLREGARG